jgi:RNA polymerase sigma-70 factor (ECF subfamily)
VRLVESYQAAVYSLALAVMRNPADAADMTQETFIRLLRSIDTYRGDGSSFSAWVHRLTVNACLDTMRRRQRNPQSSLDARREQDDLPGAEPADADLWQQPEWRAQYEESVVEVRAALAELSRSQRLALTLHYFEGRPYDEIAAAMGMPLNTVKSHILRGKERMARLLDGRRFTNGRGPQLGFAASV